MGSAWGAVSQFDQYIVAAAPEGGRRGIDHEERCMIKRAPERHEGAVGLRAPGDLGHRMI